MLTIYSYPGTRGLRVTWAAEELGIEYEYKLVNLMQGEHLGAEFLKFNPSGKVPAIHIDDVVMSESAAILTYLGDRYEKLIPAAKTSHRAHYEQLMYFLLTEFEQPLWTIGKHKFALPADKRITAVIETAQWEFQKVLGIFQQYLGDNSYLLGDNFSMLDIVAGQTIQWARAFKQPIDIASINNYADRILEREALKKAKQIENDVKQSMGSR